MAQLQQIVTGVRRAVEATLSTDQERRRAAETRFETMGSQQYPKLVYALGEILKDPNAALDDPVREQASKLLEGFIKPRDPGKREQYAKLWTQQSDTFKKSVKANLVSAMGFPQVKAEALSRAAAYCLAQIAVLEIPMKRWPNFCEQMKTLCCPKLPEANDSVIALRRNAVRVISVVCDSLEPGQHLQQSEVDVLLRSIVACFQSRSELVVGSAFDALNESLKFIETNLGIQKQRNRLLTEIMKGIQSTSGTVQAKALQCVVSLVDDYYLFVADYVEQILGLTSKIVEKPDVIDAAKMQAIEVWSSLLAVERDLADGNRNFMRKNANTLAKTLMRAMIFRNQVVAESDDVCPERSARTALRLLASILKTSELLTTVMSLAGNLVTPGAAWNKREMGFVAIGSIMEVADNPQVAQTIQKYVKPCVGAIGLAVKDGSTDKVVTKDSALWALDRIFVFALDQFPSPGFAQNVLKRALTIATADPNPQLVMRACSCIRSYFKFFSHVPLPRRHQIVNQFAPVTTHQGVLTTMIRVSESRKADMLEHNLNNVLFDCIHHIMKLPGLVYSPSTAVANRPYYKAINDVYVYLVKKLATIVKSSTGMDTELRNAYIRGYCTGLAACLLSLDTNETRQAVVKQSKLVHNLLLVCYEILKLPHGESLHEETLMVITRIVSIMQDTIVPAVPSIMAQVKTVIDSKAGDAEVILAIGLISEVYNLRWNPKDKPGAHHQIFSLLMKLIGDSTLSRTTRPLVIEAVTCMLVTLEGKFMAFMSAFARILYSAMAVGKPQNPSDEEEEDTCNFVDKLRSELLLFLSELAQVPEAGKVLAHNAFQQRVGVFLVTIARPGQASDEHVGLVSELIRDLENRQETAALAAKLLQQNDVKTLMANYNPDDDMGF